MAEATERDAYRRAVGRVVRSLRKAAGLTARQVAGVWACDPSLVSHVEAGRSTLSTERLRAFAQLVGRSPASVLVDVALAVRLAEFPSVGG